MSSDSKTPSIQEKITQLEALLAWFDGDDFSIEQSMEKFQAMKQLAESITTELDSFKNEVEVLRESFDAA